MFYEDLRRVVVVDFVVVTFFVFVDVVVVDIFVLPLIGCYFRRLCSWILVLWLFFCCWYDCYSSLSLFWLLRTLLLVLQLSVASVNITGS